MNRTASATWQGTLKEGKGTVSAQSGILKDTPYSFKSRFADGTETNPEELIAAAHAGCFTMALSNMLGGAGHPAEKLSTTANLTLEQVDGKWTITTIHLDLKAKVPGIDKATLEQHANDAKANCPVSRVLNAKISLNVTQES